MADKRPWRPAGSNLQPGLSSTKLWIRHFICARKCWVSFLDPTYLTEIQNKCPNISVDMVRRVLKNLRAKNRIECLGRGRSARWQKTGKWKLGTNGIGMAGKGPWRPVIEKKPVEFLRKLCLFPSLFLEY